MLWTTGNAHSGPFMNLAHGLVSSHSKKEEGMWIGTSLSRSVQCCSNCQEASMSNAKASSALRYLCSCSRSKFAPNTVLRLGISSCSMPEMPLARDGASELSCDDCTDR